MAVDFTTLDPVPAATKGVRMVLKHPVTGLPIRDKDGNTAALILAGKDGPQWRDAERANAVALSNARQARLEEGRELTLADLEQQEARVRSALVAVTLGWEHLSVGGETTFSPELATRFYRELVWPAEQAMAFIEDRRNYLPAPATDAK